MKLTINFEKKQIILTGDGGLDDFTQCVEALESIGFGKDWTVSFRSAEIPQVSSLLDRMSKPYTPPENPFKNPTDFYREYPRTNDPVQYPPNIVYCGDLTPQTTTATYATTNLNYDQFNQ